MFSREPPWQSLPERALLQAFRRTTFRSWEACDVTKKSKAIWLRPSQENFKRPQLIWPYSSPTDRSAMRPSVSYPTSSKATEFRHWSSAQHSTLWKKLGRRVLLLSIIRWVAHSARRIAGSEIWRFSVRRWRSLLYLPNPVRSTTSVVSGTGMAAALGKMSCEPKCFASVDPRFRRDGGKLRSGTVTWRRDVQKPQSAGVTSMVAMGCLSLS